MTDDPAYYVEPTGDEGDTSTDTPVDIVRIFASTEPVAIEDRAVTTASMVIADDYTILDLELQLSISHQRMSDLQVFLVAPDGARIELLLDTSDTSSTFDGTYQVGDILQGLSMAGTWSLEIHDLNKRMTGTLESWTLVFTHGEALLAAQPTDPDHADTSALTDEQLEGVVDAAISRWIASGVLTGDQITALSELQFAIADLSGQLLGLSDGSTIYIDQNAAGYGWFIDETPMVDEEFLDSDGDGLLDSTLESDAFGRMDLLTVVMHEIGHYLGFEHADESGYELMNGTLDSGTRLILASDSADAHDDDVNSLESSYIHDPGRDRAGLYGVPVNQSLPTTWGPLSDLHPGQWDLTPVSDDLQVGSLLQKYLPAIHPQSGFFISFFTKR
jgi:subtilisin-like proprotein convertase family protein